MSNNLRYLLLQLRNPEDPMRSQEVRCFQRVLHCDSDRITGWDLLANTPTLAELQQHDMVLLGGSGEYSATSDAAWLEPILECLQEIHHQSKPTFASCWGFQAMARAMGGTVIKDMERAELGTHWLHLTEAGHEDPIFGPLGDMFGGQMGHEDRVSELPDDAVLLASTDLVENQAYRFRDKPIYCTQFHPELNVEDLMGRVEQYPEYIHRICGMPPERFGELLTETPETEALISRFIRHVFT